MEKDIIKQIIKDYKFEQIGLDEAVDKICALAEDSIETRNCNIPDVMQQSELLLAFYNYLNGEVFLSKTAGDNYVKEFLSKQ